MPRIIKAGVLFAVLLFCVGCSEREAIASSSLPSSSETVQQADSSSTSQPEESTPQGDRLIPAADGGMDYPFGGEGEKKSRPTLEELDYYVERACFEDEGVATEHLFGAEELPDGRDNPDIYETLKDEIEEVDRVLKVNDSIPLRLPYATADFNEDGKPDYIVVWNSIFTSGGRHGTDTSFVISQPDGSYKEFGFQSTLWEQAPDLISVTALNHKENGYQVLRCIRWDNRAYIWRDGALYMHHFPEGGRTLVDYYIYNPDPEDEGYRIYFPPEVVIE